MQTRWLAAGIAAGWVFAAGTGAAAVGTKLPREMRTWTSVSGATVEAKLVFNYGVCVMLEEPDGARLVIRSAYLSAEDRTFLRGLGAARLGLWERVRTPAPEKIDINSCTFAQLKMLPGIGDVLARRIVDGRPYASVGALRKVPGMRKSTYNTIRRDIVAARVKPAPMPPAAPPEAAE